MTSTLYIVDYEGELGEAQGMFDENNELLGWWFYNDANWRNEYLSGFMNKLGFTVTRADSKLSEILQGKLEQAIEFSYKGSDT